VADARLSTQCYAVDGGQGPEHEGAYGGDIFAEAEKHNRENYAAFSSLIRATFDEASSYFSDDSVDLLHIDGSQNYEAVLHDFETWLPKLKSDGVVLFSGANVGDGSFGVSRFWKELRARYPRHIEFAHSHGLGVVQVGAGQHTVPLAWLSPGAEGKDEFVAFFAKLGELARHECEARQQAADLGSALSATRRQAADMESTMKVLQTEVARLSAIERSTLWRASRPLRGALNRLPPPVRVLGRRGAKALWRAALSSVRKPAGVSYQAWARQYDTLADLDRSQIRDHLALLDYKPLISVVMPVYETPERLLREAIASVRGQLYPNWELCVADDASPSPRVANVLREFSAIDHRIRWIRREKNGHICAATNSALQLAAGEFVALMDHDDLLPEHALYEVVVELNAHPDADVIYSDEDKIDENGKRFEAYFKTDFNPELLLGQNMVSHLGVYRRSLIERIGGLREGLEGGQDYDLALRAWAASSIERIRHIPAILYHWRSGAHTQSYSEAQLERCTMAARRAIQESLDREGAGAIAFAAPMIAGYSRIVRKVPRPEALVSFIVPTRDCAALLAVCADGILNKTDYPNLELLIVDHESKEQATLSLFEKLKRDPRVRILSYEGPFNFSAMNNMAAAQAKGDILALVNNDIEVIQPGWLTEMVSHAARPEIGAVGAKLIYPDGRIQHAGVVLGIGGVAGHSFLFEPKNNPGYFGNAMLTRAVSAITGACLVVRKSVFFEVDGLNAQQLKVAFNDIDFCLKVQAKGYRNIWTPFAELVHHESASRGTEDTLEKQARFSGERAYMRARWKEAIDSDPFYNPNVSLDSVNYEMGGPPRRRRPWKAERS
jgi:GT2 family glycosyltransferase